MWTGPAPAARAFYILVHFFIVLVLAKPREMAKFKAGEREHLRVFPNVKCKSTIYKLNWNIIIERDFKRNFTCNLGNCATLETWLRHELTFSRTSNFVIFPLAERQSTAINQINAVEHENNKKKNVTNLNG